MALIPLQSFTTSSITASVRSMVAPDGVVTLMKNVPWSSSGIKPDGTSLPNNPVPKQKMKSATNVSVLRLAVRANNF